MPKGVYKRTEQMRRNISLAKKGTVMSEAFKRKTSERMKGGNITSFKRGHVIPIETRRKMSLARKGRVNSAETRLKISIAKKGKPGHPNKFKGKKNPSITGERHPNWKGGTVYYKIRNRRLRENGGNHSLGDWENLKAQYNWRCPCCLLSNIELVRDHIIPLAKGGSNNIENIQPLCRSCNAKKHTNVIKY